MYQALLGQQIIIQSMSRKGNCLNNSPVDRFFNLSKNVSVSIGSKSEHSNKLKMSLINTFIGITIYEIQ
ncbi:hypothetical protein HMPREF0501_01271 [Limosilactobacillus coleohominis 101-4-CHN]|uniref:Integrase catalytic domain-containing protein n=1 Tax=Limosilactobacillus coleohominis 101-4-CHN TaxID=575594 RepID=C7XWY6_9LACO|nr:hypothetical protein HMPREF0501_01271 [Limosilactobacillus coleohominis 101-4-CHN]